MHEKSANSPWKNLIEGLLLLGISVFLFWYFTDIENSHDDSLRLNWIFAQLYSLGGKWLACAVVVALGVGDIVTAVRKWRVPAQQRESQKIE